MAFATGRRILAAIAKLLNGQPPAKSNPPKPPKYLASVYLDLRGAPAAVHHLSDGTHEAVRFDCKERIPIVPAEAQR